MTAPAGLLDSAFHGHPFLDPAQLALAYVTSRPFVTSNIIGATSLAQLDVALGSLAVTITSEIEDAIDAIHQVHQNPAP